MTAISSLRANIGWLAGVACLVAGCSRDAAPDAYGNFEATEVVVAAQTSGQIETFTATEGDRIEAGVQVASIDTTQLALQRAQLTAQRAAADARTRQASEDLAALVAEHDVSRRTYDRTKRLISEHAATSQQLDQAERDYNVLGAKIEAARAASASIAQQAKAAEAGVATVSDRISKSRVLNPRTGTVLTTYARAGEIVQPGTPLYRIANLDTLVLRAYVSETQLASFKLGQRVTVRVDRTDGKGARLTLPGTVTWVSATSEFTPTPVQTRDERADLVYAVKVLVPNPSGVLKIGMPADLSLTTATDDMSDSARTR